MHTRPLGLTDAQLAQLQQAVRTVLPSAREEFLVGVARRLGSEPSDDAVQHAIAERLSINKLPVFWCDHARKEKIK
jgi:hypothetical protein